MGFASGGRHDTLSVVLEAKNSNTDAPQQLAVTLRTASGPQ